MGPKKCCEIFFQSGKEEKGMADETIESLAIKFGVILEYLKEIKGNLSELPCDDLGKDVALNAFEVKHLKEAVAELKKEKDDEIYPRLRKAENRLATLTQENKGQAFLSDKMWGLLGLMLGAGASALIYFLTRD